MRTVGIAALATSVALTGCAIHPDPEDYTGVSTHNIVRRVRCEARDEIQRMLADWLKARSSPDPAAAAGVEKLHDMGRRLAADRTRLASIRAELKRDPQLKSFSTVLETTMKTGIAYHFEFDITETNDLSAGATLSRAVTGASGTLGLGASVDRTRENTRTFDTSDTFERLYDLHERYCEGLDTTTPNHLYPMAGHVGLDKTLRAFFELMLTDAPTTSKSGTPSTMSDNLVFTTTLRATLTPSIVYAPVDAAVKLSNGTFTSDNQRQDKHRLITYLAASGDTTAIQSLVFASWTRTAAATSAVPAGRVDNETLARLGLADELSRRLKFQLVQ